MGQSMEIMSDSDTNFDDLPPLIKIEPTFKGTGQREAVFHHVITTTKQPTVYPTAGMKYVGKNEIKNYLPDLIETDPSKPKPPEPEPIVYKTLIARGVKIEIQEKNLKEIPYLETLFSGRFTTDHDDNGCIKSEEFDPDILKVIVRYLTDKKLYKLFACLPNNKDPVELLETFRFLALEPPIDIKLSAVRERLMEPPTINVTTQNELIKYAFALFYSKGQIKWKFDRKLRDMVYNTLMYVYKKGEYDTCFKPRAKSHLKNLVLHCVSLSYNQYHKIKQLEIIESLDNSDEEVAPCNGNCKWDVDDEDDDPDDLMLSMLMNGLWHDPWNPYADVYDPEYSDDSDLYYYCDVSDDEFDYDNF